MKSVIDYINYAEISNLILAEEMNLYADENIITEAFKSSILQKLAQRIYDAEKNHNKREIENNKERKERDKANGHSYSDSWYKPNIHSFASILGPITKTDKYSGEKQKLRGIKWYELTDSDFKEYGLQDKALIQLVKKTYTKPAYSMIIIADKNDNPINFIKAFNTNPKQDGVFYFKDVPEGGWGDGVQEIQKKYYSYQYRGLNTPEVLTMLKELSSIEGIKAYALEITDSMIQDYNRIVLDRKEAQKGIVYYDKESLAYLLKQQQARYKVLVKKMKEEKLAGNMDEMWDAIQKAQEKVVNFYKEYVSKPENLDKYCSIGDLMRNVSYSYETLINYYVSTHKANKRDEELKALAKERDLDLSIMSRSNYERENATNEINKSQQYLKEIDKEIDRIKRILVNKDED